MKSTRLFRTAIMVLLLGSVSPLSGIGSAAPKASGQASDQPEAPHAPRRALVGVERGQRARAENSIRGQNGRVLSFYDPGDFFVVETPSRAPDWAGSVRARPGVRFAEPDYLLTGDAVPNDPRWPDLWGLKKIGMETAWDTNTGSDTIVAGVIDSGVDYSHPDIGTGRMWTNPDETLNGADDDGNGLIDDIHGADCANNDGDPMDDNNHGTHVAGTVGAATNNATGVAGVNWNVKVMALKFLGSNGSGYLSDAIECIDYGVSKKAHLTNNSWSGGRFTQALYDAIGRARAANQLFVAAAGNSNVNNDESPTYPASYDLDNIVAVAATGSNDAKASFSSYGKTTVDLAAPGVSILSTVRGGYSYYNGTSMATPHVAGAAALLLAKYGSTAAYSKVRDTIFSSVDPVAGLADLVATGGRLNVARAIQADLAEPAPGPGPSPTPTTTTFVPGAVAIDIGRLRSGSAAGLASDDNSHYSVYSTTSGARVSSWYGVFSEVPSGLESLKVTYRGKNSKSCTQTISVWQYTTNSWVQLDSRSVGTTEVTVGDLVPPGVLGDYVGPGGEARVRIGCARSSGSFYSSGELMKLTFQPL